MYQLLHYCRGRRSHLSARSVLLLRRGVHRTPAPSTHRFTITSLKSLRSIAFLRDFALFAFCSEAVSMYGSHSQKAKFCSISRSLPACRNLLFGLFLHADKCLVDLQGTFVIFSYSYSYI